MTLLVITIIINCRGDYLINKLEQDLVFHAAPTIFKIKVGSLINHHHNGIEPTKQQIKVYQEYFSHNNLNLKILCFCKKRILLYLYNEQQLMKTLRENSTFLNQFGYQDFTTAPEYLNRLAQRINFNNDFPHEIGLFLGYPLADVKGFIDNDGHNFLSTGLWKVYSNPNQAKCMFNNYKKCTNHLQQLLAQGTSLLTLSC